MKLRLQFHSISIPDSVAAVLLIEEPVTQANPRKALTSAGCSAIPDGPP
jgi:hypothetical protein